MVGMWAYVVHTFKRGKSGVVNLESGVSAVGHAYAREWKSMLTRDDGVIPLSLLDVINRLSKGVEGDVDL
ncbi:hypothetical protein Acr_10g0009870 [Actinidia rufa]|uniref:Uncharacterized protein n=1 Tax=Actinidia rufa TaxID=165716 RepID=A0A7J0FA70_9ERIC|nr:hypothetical protein Acr_10g0009870 [Actinidia rufa]